MANLQIVISALNKASGDLNKVKQDISGVKDAGEKGGTAVQGFGDSLSGMMGKAALVAGVVAGVGVAMKEVYETAKEGAELEYARTRFDNLSASIGTVSAALLGDLRDATSGMMSDAELVAGATDFMALGLAKSHDEVVRLTSVAGALGMNMNQLVLTLTNQTTMRFDALGISVDGFDAKVKALEASGLSASEAFSEAFLQQAEEQIGRVGSVADSSVGSFKMLEAGFKNIGDAAKTNLTGTLEPALEGIAGYISEQGTIAQANLAFENLVESMDAALIPSTKLSQEFYKLMGPMGVLDPSKMDEFNALLEYYSEQVEIAKGGTQNWADANYDSAEGMAAARAAVLAQKTATEELTEAQKKMIAEHEKISTLDNNYKGIIDLSYKYTDILEEITVQEQIMAEEPIGSEKYEEAKAKVDELKGSMDELANRVTLDMLQATIAIGGVTEAELSAYMQMAIDMGLMSEEGAQAAMDAYGNAIETINGYELDDKTGNIKFEIDDSAITGYSPPTRYGTVVYTPSTRQTQAVGGAVYAGNPYTWQEYGYRGELFIPSQDGYILSRADAERALARALYGGESAIDPEAIGKAVAKALSGITGNKQGGGNVYNLTMPTSSNPADVRTAFELMEAWGA